MFCLVSKDTTNPVERYLNLGLNSPPKQSYTDVTCLLKLVDETVQFMEMEIRE